MDSDNDKPLKASSSRKASPPGKKKTDALSPELKGKLDISLIS